MAGDGNTVTDEAGRAPEAGQAREVGQAPEVGRAPEARVRWVGLWDSYFAICYLITAGLVFASVHPQIHRIVAISTLTLVAPWYAGLGRPLMHRHHRGRRNVVFSAGLLALFMVAAAADLMASFALFAVVPMLMMSLNTAPAIAVAVLANLFPVTVLWLGPAGDRSPATLFVLLASLLGIALSALLGLWIKRVVRLNREHAELIEELRRNREQVARLSHRAGISAERERLAREIHDTLAQSLTSVISLVQAAESEVDDTPDLAREHLALAGRVAKESLAEAREFVAGRSPAALQESSLAQAVRRQTDGLVAQTGLPVRFRVEGAEQPLPMPVSVVLLRAAQETLANIRKHAEARTVDVELRYAEGGVGLVVRDDGKGFDTDGDEEPGAAGGGSDGGSGGFGLRGLEARVAEIGGVVTVVSGRGEGTRVGVRVPLERDGREPGAVTSDER
ncbi:sensor histidine kinase [Streptomyces piniterrae]|uniref:Sensor histidine kinase n=1 Tax=Streptomyces piniterrae TaxID=2571125 RepID=A0A4U0MXM9_9ACTN|nr:sensor histidine kinase [Streptomyces piniterrae]TJZ45382.1 sensor histidine kinase [Streptomyces piniterrae]